MKRLRRWLFNGLAALSLALCLGTILFWKGSYSSLISINWCRVPMSWDLHFSRGEMSSSIIRWGEPIFYNPGWTFELFEPRSLLDHEKSTAGVQWPWQVRFRALGFGL